jgi:leucyl aminopeptidase
MSLQIQMSSANPASLEVDVLAVCVTEGALGKDKLLGALDGALGGALTSLAAQTDFHGGSEQTLDLLTLGRLPARRVLLLGAGSRRGLDDARVRTLAASAARAANGFNAKTLGLVLSEKTSGASLRAVAEGLVLGEYRFTKYFTGERVPKAELGQAMVFKTGGRPSASEKKAIDLGKQVAQAVCHARDAVNEPPNELTPEALAGLATQAAKKYRFRVTVLDKKGIARAGMKLHYAVGQGSTNEPRFIHMTYAPRAAKKKIVFVGKGLTFDSGGLCIKPAAGMGEMKSDMGGAAAVLGTMMAVGAVRPNVEVHGIIGAAENMPDGAAYRPGDIFGSLDGKSVEIINTDAEGRLVLADALAYATKLEPDVIVDAATLTGACVVALGKTYSAFYTGEEQLARQVDRAAKEAGENLWRMPLIEELREQLKSDVADLKHMGERWGGSITAALFLREFVGKVPWIHCDIAGPALSDRARGVTPKGGTGHPVLTFLRFVENAV